MAGFSPIETPNFAQAALGGYQAGRAMGQQRRRDEALTTYGKDPDAGITALESVDPQLAEQLRANRDKRQVQEAYSRVFSPPAALGGQAPAASSAPDGGGMPQTAPQGAQQALGAPPAAPQPAMPQAAPAAPQAPAPTAGGLNVNMEALQQLASLGPEGAKGAQSVYALIQSGNEQRIRAFANHAEMRGQLAMYLKTLPPEQRAQAYEAALPELTARGFIPQAVQGMRFDDAMLDRDVALAVPTVQALSIAREDRKEKAANAARAADDARADAGLGIRRSALELAKERARKAGAGGAGSGAAFGSMDDAALLAIANGSE